MSTTLTALFTSSAQAAEAARSLEVRGFAADDISIIAGESFDREAFGVETHSKMPEGVAVGGASGAAAGALVAGMTAVGAIATGGLGVLAAGPVVAALTGAGAGAAGGGALGGLIGLGFPEHEVKHYEDALEKVSVLLGVECEDSDAKDRAKEIFESCGAEKVAHA